jgi:ribosomal protein S18 acetylase RimI-like enzyme
VSWLPVLTEPGVTLHRVRPEDWRSHRDLRLEMLQDAPDAFWTQYADVADVDEATWRGRITAQHHLQARIGDDVVGSVGVFEDADEADDTLTLVAMYVTERARGRGVGDRLVRAVLDEALARGRRHVVLEVTSGNDPAISLYRRMGFAPTGERSPHPRRADLSELRMRCDLAEPRSPATRMPRDRRDLEG